MSKFAPVEAVAVQDAWVATGSAPMGMDMDSHMGMGGTYNEAGAREYLSSHRWPMGLQDAFIKNLARMPMRFFICDDSGSMGHSDGHKLMSSGSVTKLVGCTRWQELTEGLRFHAGLAHAAHAPTEFRLLNGAQPIRLGTTGPEEEGNLSVFMGILDHSPGGQTPLCRHIEEVIAQIRPMAAQLRAAGQKACVIIASDGESSDGDIVRAMRPLKDMPVWVVVRLCTDEEKVVEYWNSIDQQLEMDMDVLDDLCGEAAEVYTNNPWLTYGEPLHRLREFGVLIKEMDIMDSDKLSLDQVRSFCCHLFGGAVDNYPHPELDFSGFVAAVEGEMKRAPRVWDPITKKEKEWVNRSKLRGLKGGCSVC